MQRPPLLALLLLCCTTAGLCCRSGALSAADIPIEGYPSIPDPDELGMRSAIIVFLQEKKVPYPLGIDDDHLLDIYEKYWIAQRQIEAQKAKAAQPIAAAPSTAPDHDPQQQVNLQRENIKLQLDLQYHYTQTVGKSLPELQEILTNFQRNESKTTALKNTAETAAPAAKASQAPAARASSRDDDERPLSDAEFEARAANAQKELDLWKQLIDAEVERRRIEREGR